MYNVRLQALTLARRCEISRSFPVVWADGWMDWQLYCQVTTKIFRTGLITKFALLARLGLHNDFTHSMLKANRWALLKKLEKVELN